MGRRAFAASALVLLVWAPAWPQSAPSFGEVMGRVAEYLRAYGREYSATVATERYVQEASDRSVVLESDFGILKLDGTAQWLGFRDVVSVDGKPVGDREARLTRLFSDAAAAEGIGAGTATTARRIVRESARFNIGNVQRTINNPALVLELLDPRHHRGFRFSKQGEETIDGIRAWKIAFLERQSPTVVRTDSGRDVAARGDILVDPSNGRLLRADVTLRFVRTFDASVRTIQARVRVAFKENATLGFWVPDSLTEEYMAEGTNWLMQNGSATYSNYRQFRTESRIVPR